MAYWDVASLTQDGDFHQRVAACYSTEAPGQGDPGSWASEHAWQIAASPGFGDAYASAVAGGVERPGKDPSVISDAQILAAVQPLLTG